jgi:hypothetical protein
MKMSKNRRKQFSKFLLLGLAAVLPPLSGCTGDVQRSWSEEVGMEDGSTITINRRVEYRESNSLTGDAYSTTVRDSTLEFTENNASLPKWAAPLMPILLYLDNAHGEWVVVATTTNCDTWREHGSPQPPYWEFRLVESQWRPSRLSESSIGRSTNLFFDYASAVPASNITKEAKRQILASSDFERDFLGVYDDVRSNCIEARR